MSHSIVQPQKRFFKVCPAMGRDIERRDTEREETGSAGIQLQKQPQEGEQSLGLDCLVKAIKVDGKIGLLSRVTYSLTQRPSLTGQEALRYAEAINCLLVHSQVFVIQDVDGDRGYSLQMDTLLSAPYCRRDISHFLDQIAQDAGVLVRYCRTQVERPEGVDPMKETAVEGTAVEETAMKETFSERRGTSDIKISVTNLARVGVWPDNQNF